MLLALYLSVISLAAPPLQVTRSGTETALFAGGSFWSLQKFLSLRGGKGIITTTTGYSGGSPGGNPTYSSVTGGEGSYREVVQVVFDPAKLPFSRLVEIYFHLTDPYDSGGQFCDRGEAFRPAIYFESEAQRKAAGQVQARLEKKLGKGPFKTELLPARAFHAAEPRHQEYYESSPVQYKLYLFGCGRDERLEALWGK